MRGPLAELLTGDKEKMTDILKSLANLGRIHRKMAEPFHGGTIECEECRTEQSILTDDVARYLARGWPICCGRTVKFTPARLPR